MNKRLAYSSLAIAFAAFLSWTVIDEVVQSHRNEWAQTVLAPVLTTLVTNHAAAANAPDVATVMAETPTQTIEHIGVVLSLARSGNRDTLLELTTGELVEVLSLRCRFSTDRLASMSVKDVVADRLDRWIATGKVVDQVRVDGSTATGRVIADPALGLEYAHRAHFFREADRWIFDWWRFQEDYVSAWQLTTLQKPAEFAEHIVFREVGFYPSEDLWERPGSESDLATLGSTPR